MKEVHVSPAYTTTVSDEDYERVMQLPWYVCRSRKTIYAQTILKKDGRRTCQTLHRYIMNAKRGEIIDHLDRNGLNNTRENLRRCTASQNNQNTKARSKHKFKGVSKATECRDRWFASIRFNRKLHYLGIYPTKAEAARAYDVAAIKFFGPNATTNASLGLFGEVECSSHITECQPNSKVVAA